MRHTGARFAKWGMLPLRVVVGLVFLMHGAQKLFVFGLGGTADIMGKLGLPPPSLARVSPSPSMDRDECRSKRYGTGLRHFDARV